MAVIHRLNSWERRISCVVHPEAVGVVESEKFGGIRTEVGPAGYVLQDGTRVREAEVNPVLRMAAALLGSAGVK